MRRLLLALLLLAAQSASAHHSALHLGGSAPQLLEPEKAFRFSAQVREGAVEVRFAIADGYYSVLVVGNALRLRRARL